MTEVVACVSKPISQWTPVCQVSEVPIQGARVLARDGHPDIAVFRTADDSVFALINRCPHKAGPLSEGIVHGHTVTCPLHALALDLKSGCAHAPDEGVVQTIAVRVDAGRVYLDLPGSP